MDTTRKLLQFWAKARIPTRKDYNIIVKVKELHGKRQALKKNSSRKTVTQKANEDAFSDTLNDLFDVAHADATSLIKTADRKFLEAQRAKGRRGCMGPVDCKLSKQEDRHRERDLLAEERRLKEERHKRDSTAAVSE